MSRRAYTHTPPHNGGPGSTRRRAEPVARAELARLTAKRTGRRTIPPDADPIDAYLELTHDTLTMQQQAEALGVSRHTLCQWRRRLYADGRLSTERRAGMTRVGPDELRAIAGLWARGMSAAGIAEARGISVNRVEYCLMRSGAYGRPRVELITAKDVSRLFGISDAIVHRWIDRGWLPITRQGRSDRASPYGWARDDLEAFILNRDTWVAWGPAQIADLAMRERARAARASANGAWHQHSSVFLRLGVNPQTGSRTWVPAGLFGDRPETRYGSGRYVWLTTNEAALIERLGAPLRAAAKQGPQSAALAVWRARPRIFAALATAPRAHASD